MEIIVIIFSTKNRMEITGNDIVWDKQRRGKFLIPDFFDEESNRENRLGRYGAIKGEFLEFRLVCEFLIPAQNHSLCFIDDIVRRKLPIAKNLW